MSKRDGREGGGGRGSEVVAVSLALGDFNYPVTAHADYARLRVKGDPAAASKSLAQDILDGVRNELEQRKESEKNRQKESKQAQRELEKLIKKLASQLYQITRKKGKDDLSCALEAAYQGNEAKKRKFFGQVEWPAANVDAFVVADDFMVRGKHIALASRLSEGRVMVSNGSCLLRGAEQLETTIKAAIDGWLSTCEGAVITVECGKVHGAGLFRAIVGDRLGSDYDAAGKSADGDFAYQHYVKKGEDSSDPLVHFEAAGRMSCLVDPQSSHDRRSWSKAAREQLTNMIGMSLVIADWQDRNPGSTVWFFDSDGTLDSLSVALVYDLVKRVKANKSESMTPDFFRHFITTATDAVGSRLACARFLSLLIPLCPENEPWEAYFGSTAIPAILKDKARMVDSFFDAHDRIFEGGLAYLFDQIKTLVKVAAVTAPDPAGDSAAVSLEDALTHMDERRKFSPVLRRRPQSKHVDISPTTFRRLELDAAASENAANEYGGVATFAEVRPDRLVVASIQPEAAVGEELAVGVKQGECVTLTAAKPFYNAGELDETAKAGFGQVVEGAEQESPIIWVNCGDLRGAAGPQPSIAEALMPTDREDPDFQADEALPFQFQSLGVYAGCSYTLNACGPNQLLSNITSLCADVYLTQQNFHQSPVWIQGGENLAGAALVSAFLAVADKAMTRRRFEFGWREAAAEIQTVIDETGQTANLDYLPGLLLAEELPTTQKQRDRWDSLFRGEPDAAFEEPLTRLLASLRDGIQSLNAGSSVRRHRSLLDGLKYLREDKARLAEEVEYEQRVVESCQEARVELLEAVEEQMKKLDALRQEDAELEKVLAPRRERQAHYTARDVGQQQIVAEAQAKTLELTKEIGQLKQAMLAKTAEIAKVKTEAAQRVADIELQKQQQVAELETAKAEQENAIAEERVQHQQAMQQLKDEAQDQTSVATAQQAEIDKLKKELADSKEQHGVYVTAHEALQTLSDQQVEELNRLQGVNAQLRDHSRILGEDCEQKNRKIAQLEAGRAAMHQRAIALFGELKKWRISPAWQVVLTIVIILITGVVPSVIGGLIQYGVTTGKRKKALGEGDRLLARGDFLLCKAPPASNALDPAPVEDAGSDSGEEEGGVLPTEDDAIDVPGC
jgi:hypothetical protein